MVYQTGPVFDFNEAEYRAYRNSISHPTIGTAGYSEWVTDVNNSVAAIRANHAEISANWRSDFIQNNAFGHRDNYTKKSKRDGDSLLGNRKHDVISVSKVRGKDGVRGRDIVEHWYAVLVTDTGKGIKGQVRHSESEVDEVVAELRIKYGV